MWWFLGILAVAHVIIIARVGFSGIFGTYLLATICWIFYPGYASGLDGWLLTNLVFIGLMSIGSLLPNGGLGIIAAAIGGYLIGKNIAKL